MRGIGAGSSKFYEFLENAKPGQKVVDPGFGSYSFDPNVAERYASSKSKTIVLVSRNKNLRPVTEYSGSAGELEAILPKGTEQTIVSVTKLGESLIVELD
jgi:hypothetical protein